MDSLAEGINRAVKDGMESKHAQQVRDELGRAAQSAQVAGTQAFRDAKPHIVASLHQLSIELQKMIERMEKGQRPSTADKPDDDDVDIG